MGSKTPSTQTVTNKTEVDPVTQKWRDGIFNAGTTLYNQGPADYYPGNTVAPFSSQTQSGLGMMQNQAQQGAVGLPQAYNAANRGMSGFSPGMNTAMQASNGGMSNGFYGNIASAAGQTAMGGVQPMLNGVNSTLSQFTGDQNPHLQQLYEQGATQITDDLNARFASAGRTGANAAYGKALGSSLGNLWTGIMAPGYEAAQDRKMNAAGMGLQSAGLYADVANQDINRGLSGATSMAGLYANDMDRRLSGAGMASSMFSQGNADASRASGDLAGLYQYGQMPGQSMLGVGSAYDSYNQQLIDADMARYNYGQNAQWDNLSRFSGMMNGLPDFSSQTTTTTGGAGQNRLMGAMGGGLGMYSALMLNPATAPFAMAGAGLGALGGAFG